MLVSEYNFSIGAYSEHKEVWSTSGVGYVSTHEAFDTFSGLVSSIEMLGGALTDEQISKLYMKDENYYKIDLGSKIALESPALSEIDCIYYVVKRGLHEKLTDPSTQTLVCQYPFDIIINLNSDVLWVETLPLDDGPYHSIRSVDDLFRTGITTVASMSFYEPTFTYGVYEFIDELNKYFIGKIIIPEPTNKIEIIKHSSAPDCGESHSCYTPFAAHVDIGETVIWETRDLFSHTVTSGTPYNGPDGLFDINLKRGDLPFYYTFEEEGTYDYYCVLHPWMVGKIIVGEI